MTLNDMRIYVSGGAYIDCACSRWDQDNYSLIVEAFLNKSQRDLLRSKIKPGAVAELYQLLGRSVYYDTSFGSNTIRIVPISGTQLYNMHSEKTIYVKRYSERITDSNDFHIKIEAFISGSLV